MFIILNSVSSHSGVSARAGQSRGQWPFLQGIQSCGVRLEGGLPGVETRGRTQPLASLPQSLASPSLSLPGLAKTPEDGISGGQGRLGGGGGNPAVFFRFSVLAMWRLL